MPDTRPDRDGSVARPDRQGYEIRVWGHLGPRWADWFDGMTVTAAEDGSTVLHGTVTDQSELHGILRRLSDLGLPLVSLVPTDRPHPEGARDDH
jgi:hypothetical protein